jgi:tetratricopeptide (TPR) repeat protein
VRHRDAAVTHLRAASNLTVPSAEVRAWYGRALLAKGEPQSAVEQLKKSIELDARDPLVHVQLGTAYERLSNATDAVEAYRAAQQLAPQMVEPYEALGTLYANQNRCQDALPQLEKASALARNENRIRIALADCKTKLGRHAEAVTLYRRVLQADPKQVGLYYKIARAQHEATGLREAMSWYEQAAREEPSNAMPHYYMGFAHKERGRAAKAITEFREYLRISPNALDRQDIEREIEDLGGGADTQQRP